MSQDSNSIYQTDCSQSMDPQQQPIEPSISYSMLFEIYQYLYTTNQKSHEIIDKWIRYKVGQDTINKDQQIHTKIQQSLRILLVNEIKQMNQGVADIIMILSLAFRNYFKSKNIPFKIQSSYIMKYLLFPNNQNQKIKFNSILKNNFQYICFQFNKKQYQQSGLKYIKQAKQNFLTLKIIKKQKLLQTNNKKFKYQLTRLSKQQFNQNYPLNVRRGYKNDQFGYILSLLDQNLMPMRFELFSKNFYKHGQQVQSRAYWSLLIISCSDYYEQLFELAKQKTKRLLNNKYNQIFKTYKNFIFQYKQYYNNNYNENSNEIHQCQINDQIIYENLLNGIQKAKIVQFCNEDIFGCTINQTIFCNLSAFFAINIKKIQHKHWSQQQLNKFLEIALCFTLFHELSHYLIRSFGFKLIDDNSFVSTQSFIRSQLKRVNHSVLLQLSLSASNLKQLNQNLPSEKQSQIMYLSTLKALFFYLVIKTFQKLHLEVNLQKFAKQFKNKQKLNHNNFQKAIKIYLNSLKEDQIKLKLISYKQIISDYFYFLKNKTYKLINEIIMEIDVQQTESVSCQSLELVLKNNLQSLCKYQTCFEKQNINFIKTFLELQQQIILDSPKLYCGIIIQNLIRDQHIEINIGQAVKIQKIQKLYTLKRKLPTIIQYLTNKIYQQQTYESGQIIQRKLFPKLNQNQQSFISVEDFQIFQELTISQNVENCLLKRGLIGCLPKRQQEKDRRFKTFIAKKDSGKSYSNP